MLTKNRKNNTKYSCIKCHYITNNKTDFSRHLLTRKHKKMREFDIVDKTIIPICEHCNKEYKTRQGLWNHKKKCLSKKTIDGEINDITNLTNIVTDLINQNNNLQDQILQLTKNGIHNVTMNNNTTINKNKTFNLNLFLNDTCKNAMNITDFIKDIKIQIEDLEQIGKLGYVDGISNIILKNLKDIDITKRPLHCSDVKREIMYIKDEDKWEKDNEQKEKMKHVVQQISNKNMQAVPQYKAKYPDCSIRCASQKSNEYDNIIIECIGGSDENKEKKDQNIIKKIATTVAISK